MLTRRSFARTAATMVALPAISSAARAAAGSLYMPAETHPHERTIMQWPVRSAIYGGARELKDVQAAIARIAKAIARFEPVAVLAGAKHHDKARKALGDGIELWDIDTEDLWCRDSGPTFLIDGNGGTAVTHFGFNGWGGKQGHRIDGAIAHRVADRLGLPFADAGVVGEGGGVETDGAGTLLAHESSWVIANRNGAMTRDVIEQRLLSAMGARSMIWAPGIKGADITDYHIDALARFVGPGRVLIELPAKVDRSDPWSVAAFQTYDILKAARDADGRPLDIVVIASPDYRRIRSRSETFVSSYVNYFVCNGGVICAEFGDDRADAAAAQLLGQLYPGRTVVALNVDPIGEAGGGIHCATQQQPKPV